MTEERGTEEGLGFEDGEDRGQGEGFEDGEGSGLEEEGWKVLWQ